MTETLSATTELSSLMASSTINRFGLFFRSKIAVLKSFLSFFASLKSTPPSHLIATILQQLQSRAFCILIDSPHTVIVGLPTVYALVNPLNSGFYTTSHKTSQIYQRVKTSHPLSLFSATPMYETQRGESLQHGHYHQSRNDTGNLKSTG